MRDDFSMAVKELVATRVAFRCSRPRCGQITSGPQADPLGTVNLGVAAHITAASPGGPRYYPGFTPAQRRSPENAIWLCQTCAKLADNDEIRYTADKLRAWKTSAEEQAAAALENKRSTSSDSGQHLKVLTGLEAPFQKVDKQGTNPATRVLRIGIKNPSAQHLERVQVEVEALGSDEPIDAAIERPYILRQSADYELWSTSESSRFPSGSDYSRPLGTSFSLDGLQVVYLDVVKARDGDSAITILSTRGTGYRLSPSSTYEFALFVHGQHVRSYKPTLICRRQTERWILEVK